MTAATPAVTNPAIVGNSSPTFMDQAVEFTKHAIQVICENAVIAGTWISNQTVHLVAWLKEAFSTLGQMIVELATNVKDGAMALFGFLCDTAVKAHKLIAPYFHAAYTYVHHHVTEAYHFTVHFVKTHPNETAVGAVALVVGAISALILERICGCCC
jgi:hypothetical protein